MHTEICCWLSGVGQQDSEKALCKSVLNRSDKEGINELREHSDRGPQLGHLDDFGFRNQGKNLEGAFISIMT